MTGQRIKHMKKTIFSFISALFVLTAVVASPVKNGFDLANSIIPADQILSGGPPRDGIPAIDTPHFIAASRADFLQADDRVMGVFLNGEARAYPIRIMNWHEIVNDNIKGQAIVVTFCPLCGSGVVYEANINGIPYQFGVSGLLYNSDVLLYDRQTESLWSQILAKGISGKNVNKKLTIIPSAFTTWSDWKKKYPKTRVLSTTTGFNRDYSRSPYGQYDTNSTVYFPVAFKSKKYHPKERVLGVSINGKHKVYPFSELAKTRGGVYQDELAGRKIRIEFNAQTRDGQIKDEAGNILPSINTYWFAWYAFHPDSLIFKAK